VIAKNVQHTICDIEKWRKKEDGIKDKARDDTMVFDTESR